MKTTRYHEIVFTNFGDKQKDILNFFFFIESLTADKLLYYGLKYERIPEDCKNKMWSLFHESGISLYNVFRVIPNDNLNEENSYLIRNLILYSIKEIILSDKILINGLSLLFLPVFLEP